MCREGQREQPRAFILAEPKFFGDQVAIKTKAERASEEVYMRGSVASTARSGEISRETFERSLKVLCQYWGNDVGHRRVESGMAPYAS
jgi:hypothetical protein